MRVLRVGPPGGERPAVLMASAGAPADGDAQALDLGDHVAEVDGAFLAASGLERLAEAVAQHGDSLPRVDLRRERVGAPIARPGKVVCIGLNYADHAAETGAVLPDEPTVFFKASNAVVGPHDSVHIPPGGDKTDWEVELGVVVGAVARYLPDVDAARDVIAGYCVSNDVSERAFQLERGGQWAKGKSCETFNPLGPWLVTADEVADPRRLSLRLWVNGELMQDSSTERMVFDPAQLVWYVSQFMVLEPGDLVNTGTPAGVAMGMDAPRYLRAGDVMELEISGLGRQRQVCVDA
ncbi:MAG: fumarylacetoacetate hydrolase family protein [Actinobacteria bacterium]|nr:fumarylacetoacetate hydrolase family protein [Actinomycetota bacterium]